MERFVSFHDFNISHSIDYKEKVYNCHSHDEIEIYIHINGGKHYFLDDVIYDIKEKDVMIFGSNQIHQIIKNHSEKYERYIILYKKEFLMSLGADYIEINNLISDIMKNKENILTLDDKSFKTLIKMLKNYSEEREIGVNLHKLSKFLEIIIFILEQYKKGRKKGIMKERYISNDTVKRIIDKINSNYKDSGFTVSTLSEMMHLNKCYMCEVFKKNTGITILKYINQKKILDAKAMLIQGENIVNCADKLGFGSYNDFIRVFKKLTGDSPKKYISKVSKKLNNSD